MEQSEQIDLNEVRREATAHSLARANRIEVLLRRAANFESLDPVGQVALALIHAQRYQQDFPQLIETAIRRGDANVLGQTMLKAIERWRQADAEARSNGL